MSTTTADVVVAGAGHNGLTTAAYLARAGLEVVVLDARDEPGGGAVTEELLLPGHLIDRASTGHTLIRTNPLLADDELGLHAERGLSYVDPDPVALVAFPDGERLRMSLDLDATCAELARFDPEDAEAYRRLVTGWAEVAPLAGAARNLPVGWGPSLDERLADHPHGSVWRRRAAMSAWDVISHEFRERHVRAFVLWLCAMTFSSVDLPGSGLLPAALVAGRQRRSWSIPLGGSGRLTSALVEVIEDAGGTVHCGREVTRLLLDDDRCIGVETQHGERYVARRAVVSSIHVKHLVEMAPREAWTAGFRHGVATLHAGIPLFAIHLVTTAAPVFVGEEPSATAVSSGLAGWPQDVLDNLRAIRDGRPERVHGTPWALVATPTLVDPDRAPDGHHTVKVVVPAPATPPDGAPAWDPPHREAFADRVLAAVRVAVANLDPSTILARAVHSPADIAQDNLHMIHGTAHGGDRTTAFDGPQRPAPGWADHRTPVPGLYQTGGTTPPGGSITGIPGRNTARVVLRDLGDDLDDVVARTRRAD